MAYVWSRIRGMTNTARHRQVPPENYVANLAGNLKYLRVSSAFRCLFRISLSERHCIYCLQLLSNMQNLPQPRVNNTFLEIYFLSVYISDIYKFNLLSFAETFAEICSYFNKTRPILTLYVYILIFFNHFYALRANNPSSFCHKLVFQW